jgi:predicted flap endonuclease-1-like 5' DNA nuclease
MEEEKSKWQDDLDAATESIAQAHSNARSYAATIEDLNNQILGLKARLAQQERDGGQSVEAKSQVAEMKSSYDATVTRLNSLEDKISQLLAGNAALRTQKAAGSSEAASPKKEVKAAPGTEDSNTDAPADSVAARKAVMSAIGTKIPAATAASKDDLTLIRGIGSFLEKKLNNLGIYTYEQISKFDDEMIIDVTAAIAFFPGRIQRDDWVGQASRLMEIKSAHPEALGKAAIFPNNPQDLKIVEGIGPKIEKLLKKAGIGTWEDLAKAKKKALQKVLSDAGDAYRIHDPATWPDQAKLALKGEWEKLKEYQDYLKGGKEVA